MTPEFTRKSPFAITRIAAAAVLVLFSAAALAPAAHAQTPTMLVLRAMPVKTKKGETFKPLPPLVQTDIAEIKINGKVAPITSFTPVLKGPNVLQLMVLLDSEQMLGANGQFTDIIKFFNDMPPNVQIGVGWLLQGRAKIVQPFTADHALAAKALVAQTREQAANPKSDNGNPYQCLRDLAAHWPDGDPTKLRAVLMFTDGITRSNGQSQSGDQDNPDVAGASELLQRVGVVPYPFFYLDFPAVDPNRGEGGALEGQTNYSQLTKDTGGEGLWDGQFSPGSLFPLLDKFYAVLMSEAVVTVTAPGAPGKYMRLDIKSSRDDIKIFGPDNVTLGNTIKK